MIAGPRPAHHVPPGFAPRLGTLWTAVSRAGGAVGFLPDEPEDDIRARAAEVAEEVRSGREQVITLDEGDALVGVVFLARGPAPRKDHVAEVHRLMVHPDRQGRGWGAALLTAAVEHARGLGCEQLLLSVRGGTSLLDFYRKQGWTEVGVWSGALRLGPERRDEHWFQLGLD